MNLYEHTIVARQDTSPSQIKDLVEKYSEIVKKNKGKIIKTENWGLLNLSYLIKKNKKGNYLHFKIEGSSKIINELEKNEKIDLVEEASSGIKNSFRTTIRGLGLGFNKVDL